MELTKKRLIVILSAAAALACLAIYFILYAPLINKIHTAKAEYRELEARLIDARNSIAALKLNKDTRQLITEKDVSAAIDELTKKGKENNVNFISMTPKKIEESRKGQYSICPIEIEAESTYRELGEFLTSLEGLQESLVTVKYIRIVPDRLTPSKLKTKLTFNMYLK